MIGLTKKFKWFFYFFNISISKPEKGSSKVLICPEGKAVQWLYVVVVHEKFVWIFVFTRFYPFFMYLLISGSCSCKDKVVLKRISSFESTVYEIMYIFWSTKPMSPFSHRLGSICSLLSKSLIKIASLDEPIQLML
jgi:hypothetical protein